MSSRLSQRAIKEVTMYSWNIICPGKAPRASVAKNFIRVCHELSGSSGALSLRGSIVITL